MEKSGEQPRRRCGPLREKEPSPGLFEHDKKIPPDFTPSVDRILMPSQPFVRSGVPV